jgi:hypothetical protein
MQPDTEERLERIETPVQKNNENDTLYVKNIDESCNDDTYDSVRVSERWRDPESGRILTTFKEVNYNFNHSDGFQVRWAGQPFTLKPGETAKMPRFLGEHFAYHLANHMLDKQGPNARTNPMQRPAMLEKIIIQEEPFFSSVSDSVGTATLKQVQSMNEGAGADAPISEVAGLNFDHKGAKGATLKEDEQPAYDPLRRTAETVEETEDVIKRIGGEDPQDSQNVPEDWKNYSRPDLIRQIRHMDPSFKFGKETNKGQLVSVLKKIAGV